MCARRTTRARARARPPAIPDTTLRSATCPVASARLAMTAAARPPFPASQVLTERPALPRIPARPALPTNIAPRKRLRTAIKSAAAQATTPLEALSTVCSALPATTALEVQTSKPVALASGPRPERLHAPGMTLERTRTTLRRALHLNRVQQATTPMEPKSVNGVRTATSAMERTGPLAVARTAPQEHHLRRDAKTTKIAPHGRTTALKATA